MTCPKCGGTPPPNHTCQSLFDEFLAREFSDPAYGEVHFLTVATFMVQHNQYSDAGLAWIENQLRAHLEGGAAVADIRAQAGAKVASGERDWKVTRQPDERPLPKVAWEMTIADAARGLDDPVCYRALMREWARSTLRQMGKLGYRGL